jgi:phospholipase/carboxylesterase
MRKLRSWGFRKARVWQRNCREESSRYAGPFAFTGGLIGAEGALLDRSGDLGGTPCFLGSGDPDPHVPWKRVEESAKKLSAMGGSVTLKRYPGMEHTINQDEILAARRILDAIPRKRLED